MDGGVNMKPPIKSPSTPCSFSFVYSNVGEFHNELTQHFNLSRSFFVVLTGCQIFPQTFIN